MKKNKKNASRHKALRAYAMEDKHKIRVLLLVFNGIKQAQVSLGIDTWAELDDLATASRYNGVYAWGDAIDRGLKGERA